jgi:hypothetical protein
MSNNWWEKAGGRITAMGEKASEGLIGHGIGQASATVAGGGMSILGFLTERAENAFVGATNLMTGRVFSRNKARSFSSAAEAIMPFYNRQHLPEIGKAEFRSLVTPEFYAANRANIGEFGHMVSLGGNISKSEIVAGARSTAAMEKLAGMKMAPDIRKYALNPKIASRMAVGMAAFSTISAINSIFQDKIPEPSVYYDGVNIRHVNDMGADASYGQAIMRGRR